MAIRWRGVGEGDERGGGVWPTKAREVEVVFMMSKTKNVDLNKHISHNKEFSSHCKQ